MNELVPPMPIRSLHILSICGRVDINLLGLLHGYFHLLGSEIRPSTAHKL